MPHMLKKTLVLASLAGMVVLTATAPASATTVTKTTKTTYNVKLPSGNLITFKSTPKWVAVPEARGVYVVHTDMRPSDDFFRYNNRYYVYSGGTWYSAKQWNGTYTVIDENGVPHVFRTVHREHWRVYPTGW